MRSPHVEPRPHKSGTSSSYRVKWWETDPDDPDNPDGRSHSVTFTNADIAHELAALITELGDAAAALTVLAERHPPPATTEDPS